MHQETGLDIEDGLDEDISEDVIVRVENGVGVLTLNRPEALNALNLSMIRTIHRELNRWATDRRVHSVLIEGSGEKTFCAGGDVRAVYDAHKNGTIAQVGDEFFRAEYTLNHFIHEYPKPIIALMRGVAMGGGLGISVNGSIRVVSEGTVISMPETGLGLFTDVGGTEFLGRAGALGMYAGLVGLRLTASDALYMGIATHFVPQGYIHALREDILNGQDMDKVLKANAQKPAPGFVEGNRVWIDKHFSKTTVEGILDSLKRDSHPLSQSTYEILLKKSPTSLKVVFEQLKGYKSSWSFCEVMTREFRLSQHFMEGHDFFEGVRAILVDKDKNPQWQPKTLGEVSSKDVARYFESLGDRELVL